MDEREMNDRVIAFSDLINNLLGSATSSERIDARRELVGEYQQVLKELCEGRRTTPDREAIIEECAKVCDEYAADQWSLYKGRAPYNGSEPGRADPDVQGRSDGADVCAERIRSLKTAPTSDKGGA